MVALQHQASLAREIFPVATRFLPAKARPLVLAFYDFARGADQIADHPQMSDADKLAALNALKTAFDMHHKQPLPPWAQGYYQMVSSGRMRGVYGLTLLEAFVQDAQKHRYARFDELHAYCTQSAMPVGRMLLDVCHETHADVQAADTLCEVLQLLNHVRDVGEDYRMLNRIYLPQDWMQADGVDEAMLGADACSEALRRCMNRLLDFADAQAALIEALPMGIAALGLRIEVRLILAWANRMKARLRTEDPLQKRITLSRLDKFSALMEALWREITRKRSK